MIYQIQVRRMIVGLVCLLFGFGLVAQAAPELSAASIRYCGSLRITSNGWAYLHYDLRNPDPQPARVRITVHPEGQRNKTLYDINLTIPANSRLKSRAPITIGTVPTHIATLYADNNVVSTNEILLELASPNDRFLLFLNNDYELSYGNFAKNESLRSRYFSTTTKAVDIPDHFAALDEAHLLILERPDFHQVNTRQFEALRDFVARGGTLLFADPQGLMEAYHQTPLRDLIPVTPLQLRPLHTLNVCRELGGTTLSWDSGVTFLDSVPNGGISTLTQDGYPVVHWGRYGLGLVGVCAINFSDEKVQHSKNFGLIWNHLLDFGGRSVLASSRGDQDLSQALDHITGIEIPTARNIRLFLLGYFLVVAVFIFGGTVMRKRIHAWVALSALSVLTTVLIFAHANQRARELSVYSASILTFHSEGTPNSTGEQLVSLFLKQEDNVSLSAQSANQKLRALQPPPKQFLSDDIMSWAAMVPPPEPDEDNTTRKANPNIDRGSDETIREPLRISRENGIDHLNNMLIPYQSPRFYVSLFPQAAVPAATLPQVSWLLDSADLEPWTYPPNLNVTHAVLVCEHDFYPLNVRNGQVMLSGGPIVDIMAESEEIVYLQNYLKRRKMPGPLVALIGEAKTDATGILPEQFDILGRSIYLYPAIEDRTSEKAYIPFGRIDIRADQRSSRALRRDGRWQPETTLKGDASKTYVFSAYLPPAYGRLDTDRIRVQFVGDNRGRNIEFAIKLLDRQGNELLPVSRTGDVYTFTDLPDNLVDPVDGRFEILLQARTVQAITDFTSAMRMNSWIVREFDVAAEGVLPPETRGKL